MVTALNKRRNANVCDVCFYVSPIIESPVYLVKDTAIGPGTLLSSLYEVEKGHRGGDRAKKR